MQGAALDKGRFKRAERVMLDFRLGGCVSVWTWILAAPDRHLGTDGGDVGGLRDGHAGARMD